jgi:hypothetical protein
VEHREDLSELKNGKMEGYAFDGHMADGTKAQFKDLCTPCMQTVKNHLEQIGKKIEGLSPDRKTKPPPMEETVGK